ncbi:MAG TPA: hypothetical protein VIV11_28975 [Kofleriaceae bacterium]
MGHALWLTLLVACGGNAGGDDTGTDATGDPPGEGISAMYPGDVGIGGDPRVIFADDFESYASAADIDGRWDARYHQISISTAEPYEGQQSVEMGAPQQTSELSTGLAKMITNRLDTLYLRYYSKYDTTFDIVGSSHNGAEISAGYFVNGNATPGVPANGTNKYLIAYENWRGETATTTPGEQNIYIYHPEQRSNYGDHFFPDGRVMPNTSLPYDFGPDFVMRPNFTPELGRWYAFEVMLRANTPNMRNGRVTCWVDGQIVADFPNLRLRDVETLKIDRFGISLHFGSNPTIATRKWYDNVVAATEYIGPMVRTR